MKSTLLDLRMLGNAPVKSELRSYQQHLLALQKQMDVALEAVINKDFFCLFGQQNSKVIIDWLNAQQYQLLYTQFLGVGITTQPNLVLRLKEE